MNGKGIVKATLVAIPAIAILIYAWISYATEPYWWIASAIASVFLVFIWLAFVVSMSGSEE